MGTPASLPDVARGLRYYARRSRADNTLRAYASQWRLFERWCAFQCAPSLPAAPVTVAAYMVQRAQAGVALGTVNAALAAITFAHRAAGRPFDAGDPQLALVLGGIRREHVRPQRQTKAITGVLLRQVLTGLGRTPTDLRDGALLAVLYAFGLRASEAAALDWLKLGQGRGWLSMDTKQAEVVLVGSKAAIGAVERVLIPARSSPRALRAIQRWVQHADIAPGQPLLRPLLRNSQIRPVRLHVDSVGWLVKRAMLRHFLKRGMSPEQAAARGRAFAGHSCRIGLCVSGAEAGVPLQQIARLARHRGLATTLRYCRQADMLACGPHGRKGVGV